MFRNYHIELQFALARERETAQKYKEFRKRLNESPYLVSRGGGFVCTLCGTGTIRRWEMFMGHLGGNFHRTNEKSARNYDKACRKKEEVRRKKKIAEDLKRKRKCEEALRLKSYPSIKKTADGHVKDDLLLSLKTKKESGEYYEAHIDPKALKEESLNIPEEKIELKTNSNNSSMTELSFIKKENVKVEPGLPEEMINISDSVDKVPNTVNVHIRRLHWDVADCVKLALGKYYRKSDKLKSKAEFKTVARQLSYEIREQIKESFRAFNNNSLKGITFSWDNEAYVHNHVQKIFEEKQGRKPIPTVVSRFN